MSGTYKFGFASSSGTGGSASVDWGDIGGTLSDQTDLNLALGAKQDVLLTGLTPATGLVADTDTVLQAFGKLENFARYATVAEAEAATGRTGAVVFVHETEKWYKYHATCALSRDGDLILNTAAGGTTRWESMELSHKMGETGWVNTDGATITALDATTVRLTLSSAAVYAIKGVRYELTAGNYDCVLSGAATPKFIGINAAGALYHQDTLWDFETQCPVALAYWTGTAIAAAPQTEFHGLRDSVWHTYTHNYVGLQYKSGLTFTGSVQTDNNTNPGVDTVQYLWSTTGVVQDEDVVSTPGTGQWSQTLGSGLTSATAAIFNYFYYNGSFITTLAAMADRSPFIYSGANGTPRWNNGGTLTDSVTGDYVVYHYFATPMVGGWSVFARPHNAVFTSLATALNARPAQLTWSNYAEIKHLYTAIWRVNTGWTTVTHRCKLVSLQDFRTVAGGPVAATSATDHNALSNRGATFSHPAAAVYGTRNGGIQFHNDATNGLLSSDSLIWDNVNGILKTTKLELSSAVIKPSADSTTALQVTKADGTTAVVTFDTTNSRVGIGTSTPATEFQVATSSTSSPRGVMSSQHNTGADGARFHGRKSRGTNATPTVISSGDMLTRWVGSGYDGANYLEMASIDFLATGTIASTRVPTDIVFSTATDAAPSVLTERMRITNTGNIGVGTTDPRYGNTSTDVRWLTLAGGGTENAGSCGYLSLMSNRPTATVGDQAGQIDFNSYYNGTSYTKRIVAKIHTLLTGSGGTNGFGGDVVFYTKPDNSTTIAERMRITNTGNVGIGISSPTSLGTNIKTLDIRGTSSTTGYGSGIILGKSDAVTGGIYSVNTDFFLYANSQPILFSTDYGTTKNMTLTTTGRLGIGETNPSSRLHAVDTVALLAEFSSNSTDATVVFLKNTDTGSKNWGLGVAGSSNLGGAGGVGYFYVRNESDGAVRFQISPSGGIYFGALSGSTGSSDARYNTSTKELFYDTSAAKYKENIVDAKGTERIYDLRVVNYNRKTTTNKETGLIADEVEKVIPELCYYNEKGEIEGYNKSDLVPFLLAELQKLKKKVDTLERRR